MYLIYYAASNDYRRKESCEFMDGSFIQYFSTLTSLASIGIVIREIYIFFNLSLDFTSQHPVQKVAK